MNPPSLVTRRRSLTAAAVGWLVGGAPVGGMVVGDGAGAVAHAAARMPTRKRAAVRRNGG
jgi:hypothetical protein